MGLLVQQLLVSVLTGVHALGDGSGVDQVALADWARQIRLESTQRQCLGRIHCCCCWLILYVFFFLSLYSAFVKVVDYLLLSMAIHGWLLSSVCHLKNIKGKLFNSFQLSRETMMDNDVDGRLFRASVLKADDLHSFSLIFKAFKWERDKRFVFVLIILPSQFWPLELVTTYVNHADYWQPLADK